MPLKIYVNIFENYSWLSGSIVTNRRLCYPVHSMVFSWISNSITLRATFLILRITIVDTCTPVTCTPTMKETAMNNQRNTPSSGVGSWMAILVVSLASSFYFYEFFLRVMPTVITGELMAAFSTGTSQLGQLLGCFFYAYALMQLPAGLLCDR